MPGELSNILQNIINRAAKTPTGSTGEVARMRARFEKAGDAKVVLFDLSGSMGDLIGSSNMRKIEHAKIALPPGFYEIVVQAQYTPAEIQRVVD